MGTGGVTVTLRDSVRNCKSLGVSLRIVVALTFQTFWVHGPQQTFVMWPGLPQLKQRPLQGSFFTGLVQSRSIDWGAGGMVAVEGLEKGGEAAAEVTAGGEQNEKTAFFSFLPR